MKRLMLAAAAFALLLGCTGCAFFDELRNTETVEFVEWLDAKAPTAKQVVVADGAVLITMPDGTIEAREVPGADAVDSPGAVFGERALAAIRKSVETGSPWPGVVGVLEAAALAAVGAYAAKKRKAANAATESLAVRDAQLHATIMGVRSAKELAGEPDARAVGEEIKRLAKFAGVEDGPDGLNARVEALNANVLKAK